MCYVALPEASHIATYVTRYALAVGESWHPAQRAIPEDPAGGDILVVIIGRPILLIVVIVVIPIVTAIAVAVVSAQFAIDEQILKMSRHLTRGLLPAIMCHFSCACSPRSLQSLDESTLLI